MKKSFMIISLLCFLFPSCDFQRVVDIGGIPVNPHLVLNGLVYTDRDTSYFYITKSRPVYNDTIPIWDNKRGYEIIENADFTFLVNGEKRNVKYSLSDSAYIFVGRLHKSDKITIQVDHNGNEINSETLLPAAPQVISIDTVRVKRIQYGTPRDYMMFKLKMKDNPDKNDYYRLLVNVKYYSWIDGEVYSNSSGAYYTNDPVLTSGFTEEFENSELGLVSSAYNYFSVFRDVIFQDEEYTLIFYVDINFLYMDNSYYDIEEWILSVRLQSISEDLYKYYSSLQHSRSSSSDKVTDPVVVHSNINNGLGILGACNEIKVFEYIKRKD